MKSKQSSTSADEADIKLMVDKTIERGSMTEEQVLTLGISRESYLRNAAAVAARVRASGHEFAA
jgi:hypothetical protein